MSLPKSIHYALPEKKINNKASWQIDPGRTALLIHDMQHYFINCYDKERDPIKTVIHNIKRLSATARKAGIPIFYTAQQGNQSAEERALLTDFWGKGLAADPALTNIIEELTPQEGDICLGKWRYSAFKKSDFQDRLAQRECDQLIIVGIYGHIGCLSTALEAFMLDIKPFVPIDAIGDFSQEDHLMAMSYIAHRCGFVTDTNQLISALQEKKSIPQTMSALKQLLGRYVDVPETEIADDIYLPDLGLDSIQVMQIAGHWQNHGISYLNLVQNPTPQGWLNLLLARG